MRTASPKESPDASQVENRPIVAKKESQTFESQDYENSDFIIEEDDEEEKVQAPPLNAHTGSS